MNGNRSGRHSSPRKEGNLLWVGILIGMVIGASLVAGMAWYLMKSPTPFLKKTLPTDQPLVLPDAQNAPTGAVEPDASGKPRFEFYKVLTDKQDKPATPSAKPADKSKIADSKSVVVFEPHLLQVGSFPKIDDAEKLKAKLALLGAEATIHSADIPDKGVWYRVRLGPYKSAEEMERTRDFLKQNGVESTPMRVK